DREGSGIRRGTPLSQESNRRLHKLAAAKHRSPFARDQAAEYWQPCRSDIRPGKGELMSHFDLPRRLTAEALGTALLVATVVGSGIMAESLTKDVGLALLGNTLPTGAILVVLISILGPISGAHFNLAVSLVFALKGELTPPDSLGSVAAQV